MFDPPLPVEPAPPIRIGTGWSIDVSAEDDEQLSSLRVFCYQLRFASDEIGTCSKQERGTERFGPAYKALLDLLKTCSY